MVRAIVTSGLGRTKYECPVCHVSINRKETEQAPAHCVNKACMTEFEKVRT